MNNSRIVEDVHIPSEITSDVDELIKSSTPILDEIHVHEESISYVQDALNESSTPSHDVRCSLSTPTIKEEIKHDIIATSVDTGGSLGFLSMFVRLLLAFLLDCLEFFPEFLQISIGPSNVIPLQVFDVCLKKPIYLFLILVRVLPSEFVVLYLPEIHVDS